MGETPARTGRRLHAPGRPPERSLSSIRVVVTGGAVVGLALGPGPGAVPRGTSGRRWR